MNAVQSALGTAWRESAVKQTDAQSSQIDAFSSGLGALGQNLDTIDKNAMQAFAVLESKVIELTQHVAMLEEVMASIVGRGNRLSAGGLLGRNGNSSEYIDGIPWATGDTVQTLNEPPTGEDRPGWVRLLGQELAISDYPELAAVFSKNSWYFGAPTSSGNFVLPTTTQLGYASGYGFMRT